MPLREVRRVVARWSVLDTDLLSVNVAPVAGSSVYHHAPSQKERTSLHFFCEIRSSGSISDRAGVSTLDRVVAGWLWGEGFGRRPGAVPAPGDLVVCFRCREY